MSSITWVEPKVELIDCMGDDLMVVNTARVSFDKKVEGDSLSDRDTKLIKYLAINGHWCYDDQTEVLTDSGWKLFQNLTPEDRVAQVDKDSWTMSFVLPDHYHRSWFSGELCSVQKSTVDYAVTPNHRMLLQRRDKHGYTRYEVGEASLVEGIIGRYRTCAILSQPGLGSYYDGAYLGFLLGDGFRVNNSVVRVRLKKQRKIDFLRGILENSKVTWKKSLVPCSYGRGSVTQFDIQDSITYLPRTEDKVCPDFKGKSSVFLLGLFEGLMESDGSAKHKGWVFSTTSKSLLKSVAELATLCGYQPSPFTFRELSKENPNWKNAYRVLIQSRQHASVKRKEYTRVDYNGYVYCVTVPTGLLMVRRNGKQLVSGNSPFSHPKVQFRVTLPIFVARQWEKHRIGAIRGYDIYDQNEVSRRYVDDTPEFFFPESWRARPDKSIKQGSGEDLDLRVQYRVEQTYTNAVDTCRRAYEAMLEWGVAPEQARMILPQSMMTAWIETGSLLYWARVVNLRVEGHAQKEIRDLASQVDKIMQDLFPISWAGLTNGR